jgi:hypothetical protein
VQTLINDGRTILENLATTGSALKLYAENYVKTRLDIENSVKDNITKGRTTLQEVKEIQLSSKTKYDTSRNILIALVESVKNGQTYLNSTDTALANIQNILNTDSNAYGNSGSIFGSNLQNILSMQENVNKSYNDCRTELNAVVNNYNNSGTYQQEISDNLKKSNSAVSSLNTYIRQLLNDIVTSPEYSNLNKAIVKAENLAVQINIIINNVTDIKTKETLQNTITSINIAVASSKSYRDNIINIFTLATINATVTINKDISELMNILTEIINITGTLMVIGTDLPFTTPVVIQTLAPENFSILFYYNSMNRVYANIVTQYNLYINIYNKVVENVNKIQVFANTIISDISNSISSANTGLIEAQNILKNYLPGSTTPVPLTPFTIPQTQSPIPPLTTITPHIYTIVNPRLQ